MDVILLHDPCDPCYNNPYVQGDTLDTQRGVLAKHAFNKGDVVVVYYGHLITKMDHQLYGLRWVAGQAVQPLGARVGP